jgi:hypothetical protein
MTKQQLIAELYAFAAQRPGLEPGNYATYSDYRAESRSITAALTEARKMIRLVELRPSITVEKLVEAFRGSRLTLIGESSDGTPSLDYCAGQYYPVEFRPAISRVCASALWAWCADAMPEGANRREYMTSSAKRWFGNRLAKKYFN